MAYFALCLEKRSYLVHLYDGWLVDWGIQPFKPNHPNSCLSSLTTSSRVSFVINTVIITLSDGARSEVCRPATGFIFVLSAYHLGSWNARREGKDGTYPTASTCFHWCLGKRLEVERWIFIWHWSRSCHSRVVIPELSGCASSYSIWT